MSLPLLGCLGCAAAMPGQPDARPIVAGVARALKCSQMTVKRMIAEGRYPKPPITDQQFLDWMRMS